MSFAQRLAVITAVSTLVLVGVGVLVRATGSGLGCPDWPTCHGGAIPPGHKHAIIEYSHRVVAMAVGFMAIGVAVCAWKFYRHVPFIFWLGMALPVLVGIQGILGAITVKTELPPEVVASHLLTAMAVLSTEVALAVAMYVEDPRHEDSRAALAARRIGAWSLAMLGWLAVTMWIGAYMAESGASTACKGWPLCNGSPLPAADDQEVTHMIHRYLAGALIFFVVPLVLQAWRRRREVPWSGWFAVLLGGLYVAQVTVGALNVWFTFPDPLTITHTVIAASIWFTLSGAVALTFYSPARAAQNSPFAKAGATV
jgi:heme A synthase